MKTKLYKIKFTGRNLSKEIEQAKELAKKLDLKFYYYKKNVTIPFIVRANKYLSNPNISQKLAAAQINVSQTWFCKNIQIYKEKLQQWK